MSVIKIENLVKTFGKTKAVDGISFNVEKGEIFGFLGPNGAGKTTTIRCMMDFLRADSGYVKIFDLDSRINSVKLKQYVGYLTGDVRLYNNWTGLDHIRFLENMRDQESYAKNLVEILDFNPHKKFKQLSSGNKQKLGLILALMFNPGLLILDEPTVGLDPLLQNKVYDLLLKMRQKGTTIFISSHNLAEVDKICDRVAIIRSGKVAAIESIYELKHKQMNVVHITFQNMPPIESLLSEGIEMQQQLPDGYILGVKGDINPLIRKLAQFDLKSLEITHASLDDIFLEFYGDTSEKGESHVGRF